MLHFGTKAGTLKQLENRIKSASVLPQLCVTALEWKNGKSNALKEIERKGWTDAALIVRSSAKCEDSADSSMAGKYVSRLNIKGKENIASAIDEVFASYGAYNPDDQVLVQPMLANIAVCGVAFSIDPNNGGNYIVINYDDLTGSTDTVTSGRFGNLKTFYYFKGADVPAERPLEKVVTLVTELEELFSSNKIDIEFALDKNGVLYLLQARPLVVKFSVPCPERQKVILNRIYKKVYDAQGNKPYLFGERTVFGVMPDWNPAEIIGIRPRPLALSLYKELVTDSIWAYQRDNYGYKNLRSFPLLINFAGFPYIDVRVSFNSFLPKEFKEPISEKLINYYIKKLVENPKNHDKVEFEIIYSCYTFDLGERIRELKNDGFTTDEIDEIIAGLKSLTNRIIDIDNGYLRKDLNKIEELGSRRRIIMASSLDYVSKIYWLLEDCKRYGTLPFAGLARGGFIAVQMLKSLVTAGILSPSDYNRYMSELDTVNSKMNYDLNTLDEKEFLDQYGHLRPGTYDILSKRYDEAPESYFDFSKKNILQKSSEPFLLSISQLKKIKDLIAVHGLEMDVLKLFDFFKLAIEGREYSKFVFTRNLSDAISLFGKLAQENGIPLEDASYADICVIKQAYDSESDIGELMKTVIEHGKARYNDMLHLTLPTIIINAEDVWAFHQSESEPNFITMKRAVGRVAFTRNENTEFKDSILFIPSADPGYDWIFSKNIAGLVTMYGGVNSHMAIRAGELSIPAVIGIGESLYNQYCKANILEIDCAGRNMRILA
jgi:phosphohistidine swiveling domain-containing protein